MTQNQPSLITRVNIWMQNLTKRPVELKLMGHVHNVNEAQNMLTIFYQCDAAARKGEHAYFFTCEAEQ